MLESETTVNYCIRLMQRRKIVLIPHLPFCLSFNTRAACDHWKHKIHKRESQTISIAPWWWDVVQVTYSSMLTNYIDFVSVHILSSPFSCKAHPRATFCLGVWCTEGTWHKFLRLSLNLCLMRGRTGREALWGRLLVPFSIKGSL